MDDTDWQVVAQSRCADGMATHCTFLPVCIVRTLRVAIEIAGRLVDQPERLGQNFQASNRSWCTGTHGNRTLLETALAFPNFITLMILEILLDLNLGHL